MLARVGVVLMAAAMLTGLSGCYESPTAHPYHEPGVYKGKQDPLVALQRQPEQQQRLRERFDKVQMDR